MANTEARSTRPFRVRRIAAARSDARRILDAIGTMLALEGSPMAVGLKLTRSILRDLGHSLPVIAEVTGGGTHKSVRDAVRQVRDTWQLQRLQTIIAAQIGTEAVKAETLAGEVEALRSWLLTASTPEQRKTTVVERVRRGESLRAIAADLGLSYERVRQLSQGKRPDRSASKVDLKNEIVRQVKGGCRPADIAAELGVAERLVRGVSRETRAEIQRVRSEDLRRQAVALAKAGNSNSQIAKLLDVSVSFVRSAVRSGLGPRQRPPFNRDRARELYDQGLPDTAIARELGYSVEPVRLWRVRHGLSANARGRPPGR